MADRADKSTDSRCSTPMTTDGEDAAPISNVSRLSKFELVLSCNPPILESFLLQVPTTTIFQLYHTSAYLRQFLRTYPTAWKYLSFRLIQQSASATSTITNTEPNVNGQPRQSRNYALDQLLLTVINPFSSCLTSLELDNTAVSGQILTSTVLSLRRETLEHLSIRGCKNVSLKYHIVPWLTVFALALGAHSGSKQSAPPREFQRLALKSLYTYRCRHHRRRPYLPSSLLRKDSDSEPTHELVNICHKLGIWTDTAWCTTPGARCYRRRGYVTMRVPQDPREVWVVYDRLWRSKNWIGSVHSSESAAGEPIGKRRKDGRSWEQDEEGLYGEPLGTGDKTATYGEGKMLPMHLRKSHRDFVEDVICDNCSAEILERCEQCSVLMHCAGCRKTLCASCAFERPFLRNKRHPDAEVEKPGKFWWAPGCLVSPCSMQDQDETSTGPGMNPSPTNGSPAPPLKFKWCCTEPIFSGGGGITFGPGVVTREVERVRASPLPKGHGWEDPEFQGPVSDKSRILQAQDRISDRRTSLSEIDHEELVRFLLEPDHQASHVPRNLCDECYVSKGWKVQCKACSLTLCLEHDLRGLKMRICGLRDLSAEKEFLKTQQLGNAEIGDSLGGEGQSSSAGTSLPRRPGYTARRTRRDQEFQTLTESLGSLNNRLTVILNMLDAAEQNDLATNHDSNAAMNSRETTNQPISNLRNLSSLQSLHNHHRPASPSSNATATPSRSSSPSPSIESSDANAQETPRNISDDSDEPEPHPKWSGCLSFSCPQHRAVGDHRRRCTGVMKECQSCKVLVCATCVNAMPPGCKCDNCVSLPGTTPGGNATVGEVKFWCPNCRWERMMEGSCLKRSIKKKEEEEARAELEGKGKGKAEHDRKGKGKAQEKEAAMVIGRPAKHANPPKTEVNPVEDVESVEPPGIKDELAERVGEFFTFVSSNDEHLATGVANRMGIAEEDIIRRIRMLAEQFGNQNRIRTDAAAPAVGARAAAAVVSLWTLEPVVEEMD